MLELTVPDMTCGHCVNVITRAIGEIDSTAKLSFDLPGHKVSVASNASAGEVRAAIAKAGYRVSEARPDHAERACCGSCHV